MAKMNMILDALQRADDGKIEDQDDPVFKVYTRGGHVFEGMPLDMRGSDGPSDENFSYLWFEDTAVIIREADIVAINISYYFADHMRAAQREILAETPAANGTAI